MDTITKKIDLDLVLLVALEQQPLYGLEIIKVIHQRTGGALEFKEGSLYPVLHRLVKAGWVQTHWTPSNAGGAPRKYYQLTPSGQKAVADKKEGWNNLRKIMDDLMGKYSLGETYV